MDFRPTADQEALQAGVRSFCAGRVPADALADLAKRGGFDRPLWGELAELGVFGLRLPEGEGGVGLGCADAVLVFEELGRRVVPGPLVWSHLAAGLVPVALGSDTGGSIRGPASHCGVVGLMPTFGLVSRSGVITNSYTFDHCGPLARTVEDCALTLQALAGYDPADAGSVRRPIPPYREALGEDLRGLRIGVLRYHWEEDIPASEDVRRAMDEALDVLRRLGAELEECRVRPLGAYYDVKIIIAESEIFAVHQQNLVARPKDFGADFRARVLPSVLFTAHDYVQATREQRRMMTEMEPLYARFDAFVTAGLGEAPPRWVFSLHWARRSSGARCISRTARPISAG